jgi:hypothetical protein
LSLRYKVECGLVVVIALEVRAAHRRRNGKSVDDIGINQNG